MRLPSMAPIFWVLCTWSSVSASASLSARTSEASACERVEDGFNSYIMPTALDAPRLTNENVPFAEETGPYGAKGVAEAATVAMAPAIAAAVRQILPGIRIVRLPIDRMEILRRLKEEER